MNIRTNRNGFTLVELLVVIGMLMLLIGAVSTSVASAHRRAKIQQATVIAQEMTNAILAYENFGEAKADRYDSPLSRHVMEKPTEALESELGFILGTEKRKDGGEGFVPVLFNANITGNPRGIRDPWGNLYWVTIRQGKVEPDMDDKKMKSAVSFPNFNRIPAVQR